MFAIAASHRLSISRFQVCRLNDENVLKPPHTPTEINCCSAVAVSVAPKRNSSPETSPSNAEATTLTTKVPKGKVSPNRCATQPDHQNRQILPSAPPINTKIVASIFCRIHLAAKPTRNNRNCSGKTGRNQRSDPNSQQTKEMRQANVE